MMHGGVTAKLALMLAIAHHVQLCSPFTSIAPRRTSRIAQQQGTRDHSPSALDAVTSPNEVAFSEEMHQSKLVAKRKLMAQRLRTLQKLLPGVDAHVLVAKSPRLLTSADLQRIVPARLEAMQTLMPGLNLNRVVKAHPDLLLYDVHKTLAPRVADIKKVFPEFSRLLAKAPNLLYMSDFYGFAIPKIEELASLLPGIDVLRLLEREPTILHLDIGQTVKPRLEKLADLLPGQNMTSIVWKAPRIITSSVSGVEQKLTSLRWLLGPQANVTGMIHRRPELLVSKIETTVAAKFRQLQKLFPEGDVVSMVERDATLLLCDFESIKVKVDCWRERVSNVSELNSVIEVYPTLLSYSLDASVSRADFVIQTNGTELSGVRFKQIVRTTRKEWATIHGDKYRKFLERKVEGPPALRLWPGLYFDSDAEGEDSAKEGKRLEGEGLNVRIQDGGSVQSDKPSAAAEKAAAAHVKSLEAQYGANVKAAQLRFRSALRQGKYGANPSEIDMILYDIKSFDQQVRKLATGKRLKRFRELLPELKIDRLFTDYPQIVMMDLKKVEERVQDLRELLPGVEVCSVVSTTPNILLEDVQTCLRPRMTRLVVALTVKQLEGVLDADKVKVMVARCPRLLLKDVRNVVVPSLQYMLRCTSDHRELGTRLFRDPSLLAVGVGPLARLQYTLEQFRNGTDLVYLANPSAPAPQLATVVVSPTGEDIGSGTIDGAATGRKKTRRRAGESKKGKAVRVNVGAVAAKEDQSRLLPPVVAPQILKCDLRDFVDRNPGYVSFLAQRQGLPLPLTSTAVAEGGATGGQSDETLELGGQVLFWEKAVGARLAEMFRPMESPYVREKMERKGPDGQKGASLSELDLLVGDVLYFNHRMGVLASKIKTRMPQAVDLRQEATKLALDVEWGSRQIMRLLGSGSWAERGVPPTASRSSQQSIQDLSQPPPQHGGDVKREKGVKKRKSKRQMVSGAFQSLWDYASGTGTADLAGSSPVESAAVDKVGDRETAQELERLLGEVSSYEGRLEGLLDLPMDAAEHGEALGLDAEGSADLVPPTDR